MPLTVVEEYIWNFLEDNRSIVPNLSILQISDEIHVSTASITRTVQKQGYDGFIDYKQSMKIKKADTLKNFGFSIEASDVINKNLKEVVRTINLLDEKTIEEVIKLIDSVEKITLLAQYPSLNVANGLADKLRIIGKEVNIFPYIDHMSYYARKLSDKNLVIVISKSGENHDIIQAVSIAIKKGAKVVTLTCGYQSTLARLANFSILSYDTTLKKVESVNDVESRMPLELTSRILIDLFLVYKEKGTIKD